MRRVAIAAVVALGLVAAAPAATAPPKITVSGKIVALKAKTVTIQGARKVTCRVVSVSPRALGFRIGVKAKMTCTRGVLARISGRVATKPATSQPSAPAASPSEPGGGAAPPGGTTEPVAPPTAASLVNAMFNGNKVSLSGKGNITAIGGGRVSFGASVTCTLGGGSPSVAEFPVGARVSYRCEGTGDSSTVVDQMRAGAFVLTEISSAA